MKNLTKRDVRRLASLNRQLARAIERGWDDDRDILRAEIAKLMGDDDAEKPWVLTRDGVHVASFATEADAWDYLHSRHSFSVAAAIAHEGYNLNYIGGQP